MYNYFKLNSLLSKPFTLFVRRRTTLAVKLLVLGAGLFATRVHAQGTWTKLDTTAPDYNQGVMLLLTDGSVLVKTSAISTSGIGSGWNRLTPDIHGSYAHGTWAVAGAMTDARLYFSTQVLKDGTVYAAGGEYGTARSGGERYVPSIDVWLHAVNPGATTGLIAAADTISDANSELLPDGKVLQAVVGTGGGPSKHTYIYDPVTYSYSVGPTTIGYDNESAWVKLKDNSILFVDIYGTTSERYMPATNTFKADANMPVELYDQFGSETGAAFMLPDGRAFFLGSTNNTAYYTPSGTTAHGTWSVGPVIPDSLGAPDAAAAMMVNGNILCALAHTPTLDSVFHEQMNFYEFNYLTDSFTKIPAPTGGDSIDAASYITNMLCLPDGNVLFGTLGSDEYHIYTPSGSPLAAGKPTIDSIIYNYVACDTFQVTGTLFNGISEGAGYGDDWQMSTNYPLVRLTRHDSVFYTTTYNWTSTGVMRGTAIDTVQFVVPPTVAQDGGAYQLQVVANGIASDPIPFSFCPVLATNNVVAAAKHINVYPNPASDEVTVDYSARNSSTYTIKMMDVYGRIIQVQKRNAIPGSNITKLDIRNVIKGVYTVAIEDGSEVYNTKVIVK